MTPRMLSRLFSSLALFTLLSCALSAQPWMQSTYLRSTADEPSFYEIRDAFNAWWGERPYVRSKGYKPFMRWAYLMEPKCFPDGKLPSPERYYRAKKEFLSGLKADGAKSALWTPLGIETWINGNSGYNPGNGRINAVTVDMSNRDILYVAAPSGGIWKSMNGGLTWNTTYDTMAVLGTSAVTLHPNDPNTIFVGTGDRDAWDTPGIGILKSTDGGSSWTSGGYMFAPSGRTINKILINPLNPQKMFAASSSGIYRSSNGGDSWTLAYAGSSVNDLMFRPGDTTIIYGSGDYFVRSVTAGNSFVKGVSTLPGGSGRLEIDVTPANPMVVYVVSANDESTFRGFYKSIDMGATFTLQADAPNILGYSDIGDDDSGQAWYDLAIAASPSNEHEVWVGGINMWKSTNDGVNWEVNTMWYTGSPINYIHCDIHSADFYGDTLYVGSDGGAFYTPDHGNNWVDISSGLGITQFYRMGNDPANPMHIAAGAQDVGSNIFEDGYWLHAYGADGMEALISHSDPYKIYVSSQFGGLIRSQDGGQTFVGIKPVDSIDGGWVTPYVQHPADPATLYAAYRDVWKTTDEGDSWTPLSTDLAGGSELDQLAVAASDPQTIYVSDNENLFVTHDEGITWNTYQPASWMSISGIAVDNTNPLRIWVSCTNSSTDAVLYSADGGQNWTDLTKNLTALGLNCIVRQHNTDDRLYVGTETGVVYTDSTMSQWLPWDKDLPEVPVRELEIHYLAGNLRAATYGRGIWQAPLINTVGIQENKDFPLSIYPNPANDRLYIQFESGSSEPIKLRLFTITGVLASSLTTLPSTDGRCSLDISKLAAGTYYLRVERGEQADFRKVMIVNF